MEEDTVNIKNIKENSAENQKSPQAFQIKEIIENEEDLNLIKLSNYF